MKTSLNTVLKGSSKRIIAAIIAFVAIWLLVDAHYTERDLNEKAFDTMMYTVAILLVGGVLEKRFNSKNIGSDHESSDISKQHGPL